MADEGSINASPYPVSRARSVMSDFNIGINDQNKILEAIANKFKHRRVEQDVFMLALMDEINRQRG